MPHVPPPCPVMSRAQTRDFDVFIPTTTVPTTPWPPPLPNPENKATILWLPPPTALKMSTKACFRGWGLRFLDVQGLPSIICTLTPQHTMINERWTVETGLNIVCFFKLQFVFTGNSDLYRGPTITIGHYQCPPTDFSAHRNMATLRTPPMQRQRNDKSTRN